MREVNAVATIAFRDLMKFLRDRGRIVASLVFPVIIIAALGGSLQSNFGKNLGFDFLAFTFTGILAQTLFQSAAFGVLSLIEDRENDFSQEIFVSPISRYSIILGKISGESLVAIAQAFVIIAVAAFLGVHLTLTTVIGLVPVAVATCLLGGAFGVVILGNIRSQRAANQLFPFLFFPQFFLAGIFNPIKRLPLYLDILSHISPLRYAVDLTRNVFYTGTPEYNRVTLASPLFNVAIILAMFAAFMVIGTALFVRQERNR